MGITPIDIKINQTNQTNVGKPKISLKSGATENSFNQVLAMVNFIGKTPSIAVPVNKSSLQSVSANQLGNTPTELIKFNQADVVVNLGPLPEDNGQPVLVKNIDAEQETNGIIVSSDSLKQNDADTESSETNLNDDNLMNQFAMFTPVTGLNNPVNPENSQSSFEDINANEIQSSRVQSNIKNNISDRVDLLDKSKPIDSLKVSDENIAQIESMLTALANELKKPQQTPGILNNSLVSDSSQVGTKLSVDSNSLSQVPNSSQEINKLVAKGLELVEAVKTQSPEDSTQLLHKVTQILGELQVIDDQKTALKTPAITEEKIQIILNEINAAQKSDTFKDEVNPKLIDGIKQNLNTKIIHGVSLDKNQVLHSSAIPNSGNPIPEVNRLSSTPYIPKVDDLSKTNEQPIFMNQQQLLSSNDLSEVNLPKNVEVIRFAPEVSEWINRFMKVTNGNSGSTEAKFSLFPEHLGHIEIKVTTQHGQVSAQILTDTPMAKEALEGQLQHLKQTLQQSGLHVQKLDVVQQTSVATDSSQAGLGFSQDGSHSSREQRTYTSSPNKSKDQNEYSEQKDKDGEILPITYGGPSIKTSSRIDFTA
ncbi:flagellar hook-length control protein FliK [Neobacillus rhizosphaerae]|uniref:flagellar hook-length control protein FliK n=1 Tax=Neobacillus rhizosphaerae TaxID=2880965 RepID=UPI003D2658D2